MKDDDIKALEIELRGMLPGVPFHIGGNQPHYFRRVEVIFQFTENETAALDRVTEVCRDMLYRRVRLATPFDCHRVTCQRAAWVTIETVQIVIVLWDRNFQHDF